MMRGHSPRLVIRHQAIEDTGREANHRRAESPGLRWQLGAGVAKQIGERARHVLRLAAVPDQEVRDRVAIEVPISAQRVNLRDHIDGREADVLLEELVDRDCACGGRWRC